MSCPVAAVIVAYRSENVLPACLDSLRGKAAETVVIDNTPGAGPPPGLRSAYPWAAWIRNDSNRGFAGAVNQGVAATTAPFLLLLNPDCEVLTDLDGLVDACREDGVAGAGGLLLDLGGAPQTGFHARSLPTPWALAFEALGVNRCWRRNPVNRRYRLLDLDPRSEREAEQPAGAFLLLRRDALQAVGGMDERFHPVWFEDVDLCRRLYDAGYTLRYSPRAAARHRGAHAVTTLPLQRKLQAWYGGLLRYAAKYYPPAARRRVRFAVLAGLQLRRLRCRLGGGSSADAEAYGAVFRLVRSGFPDRSAPV